MASSSCSAGWRNKARELLPFGAGLLLMALALAGAGKRIDSIEADIRRRSVPVEVVVASTPIEAGEEFLQENLAKKGVPSSGTGKRNVPARDFELLIGARAKNPIDPGEPILWTDVEEPFDADSFSKTLPKGKRALTVDVDATSSFAGLLQPGDRVDLLPKKSGDRTGGWIRDISVIAVDRHLGREARPAEAQETTTVTLVVTPGEGASIAAASAGGGLFWFLRNPSDEDPPARRGVRAAASPVEVWKGGVLAPFMQRHGESPS